MVLVSKKIIKYLISIMVGIFAFTGLTHGYVASSTNYQIQSDSINIAGATSTSANYSLEDTVGEVGTGTSTSSNYAVSAGYRAMLGSFISLSAPSDVTLSPALDVTTRGASTGSASWTVTTDNSAGYTLKVSASTDPALKSSSDSFLDYNPAGANPDYTWSISNTTSAFGYSPEGSDIVSRFKDNGSVCATGSSNGSNTCWDGFTTSDVTVAQGSSANTPSGVSTTLKFQAEIGSTKTQTAGSYSAVITVTATAL